MKLKIVLILSLMYVNAYAHKDTTFVKTYKNVTVITTSGSAYEEVNKTFIIGQYINNLSVELGFKDSINIHFRHNYTFDNNDFFKKKESEGNYINIEYRKSTFNILETLNLIEYVLINNKRTSALSDEEIKKIEDKKPSLIVKKILKYRINRPSEIPELHINNNFSYYTENNKFFIYQKSDSIEEVKLTLKNIYQINSIEKESIIVFDSRETFLYIDMIYKKEPKRVKLNNKENYYNPFSVNGLTKNIISIRLSKGYSEEILTLYFIDKNELRVIN